MILVISFLFYFMFNFVSAAPHPLTSSSIVNNTQLGLVYSQFGFKINHVPMGWVYKNGNELNSKSIELGPADLTSKTTISFRQEKVAKKTNLEQYVRQYLRDYNQYGFEVTNLQSNKKNVAPSVVVDLTQKNKVTKSRQIFFIQNEKVIIASCFDNYDNFEKSVINCNQILDSFQWIK